MNAVTFYRIAHALHRAKIPFLPGLIYGITFLLFNSSLPYTAEIGSGTKCAYGGIGVVVHGRCRIGANVILGQGVTLGGRSKLPGVPIVGDRVYLGAGARILGPVNIG